MKMMVVVIVVEITKHLTMCLEFTKSFMFIMLFCAIEQAIFFLAFLSDTSLLVYKNAINFWILTLYPTTLLNSLIRMSSFWGETIGLSMYMIMSSVNNDIFTFSFTIWMSFISSSCLIAMARTSSTMLNKNGESGHTCLVPDLKGNAFSFCPLSMMLAVDVLYMAFIMSRYAPSMPTLLSRFFVCLFVFNNECVVEFIKCFFSIYWYDHVGFVLHLVYVVYYVYWFVNIVPSLHPWDKSHLIMVYDLFNVLLDLDHQNTQQSGSTGSMHLNIIKAIYEKHTASIILNRQKLKAFPLDQEQDKGSTFTTSIQHSTGTSSHRDQTRKRNRRHPNGKEELKLIICRWHDSVHRKPYSLHTHTEKTPTTWPNKWIWQNSGI